MLVNQLREVQLVQESKILKIDPVAKKFSRYDKTVYISEPISTDIAVTGDNVGYVEASKFFALYSEIKSIALTADYCHLTLKNGAEYKLPYIMTTWEDKSIDQLPAPTATIKLAAGRLSSATLKNLANPMLQCIFVDSDTAVSCNSMVACIDGTVTSKTNLLLPPDIISLIEGSEANIYLVDNDKTYVITIGDAFVFVPVPELDYKETADVLRASLPEEIKRFPTGTLLDSLKRLSASHDFVSFKTDRVIAEEDYEPFDFPTANPDYQYNIQNLLSVLGQAKHIAQSDFALLLYGDKFLFMISPEPTEGDEGEDNG